MTFIQWLFMKLWIWWFIANLLKKQNQEFVYFLNKCIFFQRGELFCAWVCDGNLPPPLRGGGAVGHAGPDGPVLLRHLLASVIFHRSSFRDDWEAFLRVLVPLLAKVFNHRNWYKMHYKIWQCKHPQYLNIYRVIYRALHSPL